MFSLDQEHCIVHSLASIAESLKDIKKILLLQATTGDPQGTSKCELVEMKNKMTQSEINDKIIQSEEERRRFSSWLK